MTDFTIYADEDWPQPFKYQDTSGIGIDITGADILFVAESAATTIKKSTTHSTITIDADQVTNAGRFTVLLATTDTTAMGGKTFTYEIKLTLNGVARVIYPAPGTSTSFNVVPSLTDGVAP